MKQTNDVFEFISRLGGDTVNSSAVNVQMLILNNDLDVYKANTLNGMKDDLIASFLTPVANLLTAGPDRGLTIMDYDSANTPDHEVLWRLDANEVPAFKSAYEQLDVPFDEIPTYEDDKGDMEGVTAVGLFVQSEHGDMIIFQRISPSYILKKSRKLSMIFTGANFSKLDEPAAFQIGRENHVFYFDGKLYVISQGHFEYIFDYQEKKASIAGEKLTKIEEAYANNIIIDGGKSLMELLAGDKRAINKLQNLESSIVLDRTNLTKIKLDYDVDIKIDAKSGKMIIENKKDVKQLIDILNDDYLLSDMTSGKYTAQSKKKIIPKVS